jgi:putative effector of murein hydrolase
MKNTIILAVSLGAFVAATALVLSFRSSVTADSLVGYASVLTLLAMLTLEYRINWRRLFGRS